MCTIEPNSPRRDVLVEGLIYVLLVFMPLAFGAVQAWSEEVVILLSAAIVLCFTARQATMPRARLVWTWAYIPLVVFLLITLLQVLPLPSEVVTCVSPRTAALKTELLADLPGTEDSLRSMTLSFYPCATARQWRMLLSVVSVFFVVLNGFDTVQQIKRLLIVIAAVAAGTALLAIAQVATNATHVYWSVPIPRPAALGGPFVHHSHFAQFMSLSIAAALALLLAHPCDIGQAVARRAHPAVHRPDRLTVSLTLFLVVAVASVFLSLSRGGVLSMLIAAGVTVAAVVLKGSGGMRRWLVLPVILGAMICVLYVGFDAVWRRMSTLQDLGQAQAGRAQILRDVGSVWMRFPLLGTGLGTHEVVYPMFDRAGVPALAGHAENEYAQVAEETGLAGLLSMLVLGAIVAVGYVRCVRAARASVRAVAHGLGFGLLAVLVHSTADFGQHVPANAVLSAVFCALVVRLGLRAAQPPPWRLASCWPSVRLAWVVPGLLGIVGLWNAWQADAPRRAERLWKRAQNIERSLEDRNWQGRDDEYRRLIANAHKATELQPDNVHYAYWLNVYRWKCTSRHIVRDRAAPIAVRRVVRRLMEDLSHTATLCPTYGPVYCVLGQLQQWVDSGEGRGCGASAGGADNVAKAFKLAPNDPTVCYVAGLHKARWAMSIEAGSLAVSDPNTAGPMAHARLMSAAIDKLARAVALDGQFFDDVARLCVVELKRPDIAVRLAGDYAWRLCRVAELLAENDHSDDMVDGSQAQVLERLTRLCARSDAGPEAFAALANLHEIRHEPDAAIRYYSDALRLDYGNVNWRLRLARLQIARGRFEPALHELRICLRLRPGMPAARQLIAELSVRDEVVLDHLHPPDN